MGKLRVIGDVHGDTNRRGISRFANYAKLLIGREYTFQVGDLGMDYSNVRSIMTPSDKVIGGNHECYNEDDKNYFRKQPFFLGDFGLHHVEDFPPIFYLRGAWSIDGKRRRRESELFGAPVTWWDEEQLNDHQLEKATQLYKESLPEFVITHDCPNFLSEEFGNRDTCEMFGYPNGVPPTRTQIALTDLFAVHQPKLWIFGHYHRRKEKEVGRTKFVCLNMVWNVYLDHLDGCDSFIDVDSNYFSD